MDHTASMTFSKGIAWIFIVMITIGCTTEINVKNTPHSDSSKGESMKFSRKPPESWFWSHDIQHHHLEDLPFPGARLMRISAYSAAAGEKGRRFAAIVFQEPGENTSTLQDVPATELENRLAGSTQRPVSITADEVEGQPRFSLVLHKGAGPETKVVIDLDAQGLAQLANDQRRISDVTTYLAGGVRKYAAIVEERPGPSFVFTHVTAKELDAKLRKYGATPVRIRGFFEGGTRYFTAVGERFESGNWKWYDNIDGDTVASELDSNNSYPFDLDAYRNEQGVHYTVIMYRDRN